MAFFHATPRLVQRLKVLDDVGLGYLRLGQSATTLSGGEAQRVKLAAHLAQASCEGHAVHLRRAHHRAAFRRYREAAGGLPAADRERRQPDRIEHNLDVIRGGRLGDRPGSRGRRRGRLRGGRRNARSGGAGGAFVYRAVSPRPRPSVESYWRFTCDRFPFSWRRGCRSSGRRARA